MLYNFMQWLFFVTNLFFHKLHTSFSPFLLSIYLQFTPDKSASMIFVSVYRSIPTQYYYRCKSLNSA